MRKILIPVAIALIAGSSGMAFAASTAAPAVTAPVTTPMAAAQSISSTVKAIDLSTHTLTLANGIAYVLPATFKDPGLKVGDKVTVQWQMNGKAYDATKVTLG
ncbi:DUF1344 domain-containing protein [Devosia sp. 2618]|uniref:DUF1344 domain-containing protein n=1 Tax=Devosia sp. 2618 TaxID=3156454 RepID=UPI0033995A37